MQRGGAKVLPSSGKRAVLKVRPRLMERKKGRIGRVGNVLEAGLKSARGPGRKRGTGLPQSVQRVRLNVLHAQGGEWGQDCLLKLCEGQG